jgi:Leucine-rich repeat (LRR) protein
MQEFRINEHISLTLEGDETIIYVDNKEFMQCKNLVLTITRENYNVMNKIVSIDEVIELQEEATQNNKVISPQVEFWGHCSNLQAWAEYNYDSRLIDSRLAFPLLRELTELGDLQARKIFKGEIAQRATAGYLPVLVFLYNEGYFKYLTEEEFTTVLMELKPKIKKIFKTIQELKNFTKSKVQLIKKIDENVKVGILVNNGTIYGLKIKNKNIDIQKLLELVKKIKILDVSSNNIASLPETMSKLKDLESLYLNNNKIRNIPDSFSELKKLRYLNLSENKLEKVDDLFSHLNNLKILILSSNRISKISADIFKLKNLFTLQLSFNKIKNFPKDFTGLESIEYLLANNNEIEILPESIGEMKNLKYLTLSHNNLKQIPDSILDLESLEYLDLSNNMLEHFPDLTRIKNLKFCYLKGNKSEYKTSDLYKFSNQAKNKQKYASEMYNL